MKLLRRISYWLHRKQRDAELAEELAFHRAMAQSPIGNTTLTREDARAVWIWPWLESVMQDLRYAIRNLRRQPGFTAIALMSLSAAIGLNTSLFTVYDAIAWRMWSVRDPAHVFKIMAPEPPIGRLVGLSLAEFRYFAGHSKSVSSFIAASDGHVHLAYERPGEVTHGLFVSANYFDMLGGPLQYGRGFRSDEDILDAPQTVVILSYAVWRDHYGSDPAVLGSKITVDDVPFTIVGITQEDFTGTSSGREDVYMPLAAMQSLRPRDQSTRDFLRSPDHCCSAISGRLASGFTRAQAAAELNVLSRQFATVEKRDPDQITLLDPTILAGFDKRREIIPAFILMFVAVTMVLMLACANVSNLLLARAAARQHEIAVRRALGARRARIVRQLLTEGALLAVGASALGLALASRLPAYLFARIGDGPNVHITPDSTVIAYAIALAAIACVAFALAPALHGTHAAAPRRRFPLRSVLLAAQVAFSVVLLVGAALMLQGVRRGQNQDPGFRVNGVSVITLDLPASAYDPQRRRNFYAELSRELEKLPGSQPIGVTAREPLVNSHWATGIRRPNQPCCFDTEMHEISAGYFDVLGIPILAGRNFLPSDNASRIIINESLAQRYFPNENPIGQTLIADQSNREIIGVARGALLTGLERQVPLFFEPFSGALPPKLLVRSDFAGATELVAAIAKKLDKRIRVYSRPLSANLDLLLAPMRVGAEIAGMLGIFALALAAVGMSGVFAFIIEQRTKEIGIRMTLGAQPQQVITLVLASTTRAVIIGLAAGYLAAAALARLVAGFLYGVSPFDPPAYFAAGAILAAAAIAAAYLPARRATRIDPMRALRID